MIVICPTCSQKNRIPDRPRTDGVYKCGVKTCGTLLLHRKVEFHSRLITDVINDLRRIRENLESIKFSVFRQRDIYFLKEDYERSKSRLQNWFDHVEFIKDPIERKEIYGSYKQEIRQIEGEIKFIADLINKKEEIKRILQRFKPLVPVFSVLNGALKLAVGVLGIIGLDVADHIQFLLEEVQIFLIEGGLGTSK
jgi:hypothetical protein